jgi:type IV secretion system protein VirD4
MSAWGPQGTAVGGGQQVTRPGGALWLLPVGWVVGLFFWGFLLIAAALPTVTCSNPATSVCPEEKSAAVDQQVGMWFAGVGVYMLLACVMTVVIARRHKKRGLQFMAGRTGLAVVTGFLSLPILGVYALAYSVGRPRPRASKTLDTSTPTTVAQRFMAAPDTVAAIQLYTVETTGHDPGAVLGWSVDGADEIVTATPRGGTLVVGPPGSGKTSAVLIPTILIAPGAVVASSIKSDVMEATWRSRIANGRCWHFDPSGEEVTPAGVESVRWSPLVSVRSWDDALQIGKTMAEAHDPSGGGGDKHFTGRATDWVQVLLYAAHLDGRSITSVARWAVSAASVESQTEVMEILDNAAEAGDMGAEIAMGKFTGLISTPDKERGSIISTLVGLLRVYDSVAARRAGEDTNFDPRQFVRSGDTLYITAAPDKQALYAPILAALLEAIRLDTYLRHKHIMAGREQNRPHVTFVLDEANTTAPIPLPAIISEAGGQGLHLVVGIQSITPAVARWGQAATAFLTLFPVKIIFRGIFDRDTVQALSAAAGEYDRQMVSQSESISYVNNIAVRNTTPSYSVQRQKVLNEGDITGIPEGRALVWEGPSWRLLAIGMHWSAGVWTTVDRQATERLERMQVAALEAAPALEPQPQQVTIEVEGGAR